MAPFPSRGPDGLPSQASVGPCSGARQKTGEISKPLLNPIPHVVANSEHQGLTLPGPGPFYNVCPLGVDPETRPTVSYCPD